MLQMNMVEGHVSVSVREKGWDSSHASTRSFPPEVAYFQDSRIHPSVPLDPLSKANTLTLSFSLSLGGDIQTITSQLKNPDVFLLALPSTLFPQHHEWDLDDVLQATPKRIQCVWRCCDSSEQWRSRGSCIWTLGPWLGVLLGVAMESLGVALLGEVYQWGDGLCFLCVEEM